MSNENEPNSKSQRTPSMSTVQKFPELATHVKPASVHAAATGTPKADPSWWRLGRGIPALVLLFSAVAADLMCPFLTEDCYIGFASAIGTLFFMAALLLLRRDFTVAETLFLVALGLICAAGQAVSGSAICWWGVLIVPYILMLLPKESEEPRPVGRSWWGYWFTRRPSVGRRWFAFLPTLISAVVGLALFFGFLAIFAADNPVVELVWNTITEWWNKVLTYLQLDWDIWGHIAVWFIGAGLFGFFTFARRCVKPRPAAPVVNAGSGTSLLPHLPLFSLLGINLAFLVVTSTDILFLWARKVPEGISLTHYLYEGQNSVITASVLVALLLILLFRRDGSVRRSPAASVLGYVLLVQTFLLAVSVFVRLYFQIEAYGFTFRRVLGAETMLMGVVGLVLLLCYMWGSGSFFTYLRRGFCALVLFFFALNVQPPSVAAADLNTAFAPTNPHWKFSAGDCYGGGFNYDTNLRFLSQHIIPKLTPEANIWELRRFKRAAENVVKRSGQSWRGQTWNTCRDAEPAKKLIETSKTWEGAEPHSH